MKIPEKCQRCGATFCDCPPPAPKEKAPLKWSAVELPKTVPQDKPIFEVKDAEEWCDQTNARVINWLITRAAEGVMPRAELEAWYRVYREQVIHELSLTDLLRSEINKRGGRI